MQKRSHSWLPGIKNKIKRYEKKDKFIGHWYGEMVFTFSWHNFFLYLKSMLEWQPMYVVGDGNCMKEIPFLTLQRDIFDPLPPKYQPLFIGCWRRCIDRSTTNSSILHWRKKQRKKIFPLLAHHVTVVFHFFHICCLFLFYCLSNGVKSKAWWVVLNKMVYIVCKHEK